MNLIQTAKAKAVIRRTAKKNGVSPAAVRRAMQEARDAAWDTTDPAACPPLARQKDLFPDGKPSVEQFILTVAGEVRCRMEKAPE